MSKYRSYNSFDKFGAHYSGKNVGQSQWNVDYNLGGVLWQRCIRFRQVCHCLWHVHMSMCVCLGWRKETVGIWTVRKLIFYLVITNGQE